LTDAYQMQCLNFEVSYSHVKKSDRSTSAYKTLSINLMDSVRAGGDIATIASVGKIVQKWALDSTEWVNKLLNFCEEKEDIYQLLLGENNSEKEVIVVVDDTTKEWVLDYNEFLFDIRDEYEEIEDFMVIDRIMLPAVDSMYKEVNCLYERG